ncbi:MAG: hypothetical protein IPO26_17675 [Saprospiraceae bacterium]|nr:hypothetical protein [Saprospiraceae bacterium]
MMNLNKLKYAFLLGLCTCIFSACERDVEGLSTPEFPSILRYLLTILVLD